MYTRTSSAILPLFLLLCACGRAQDGGALPDNGQQAAVGGARIECAAGDAALAARCTVDREAGRDGPILVLRNPDGGFHRLRITRDGRGLIAADGAEPARVVIVAPGLIEVAIGGDRYRLPATVSGR